MFDIKWFVLAGVIIVALLAILQYNKLTALRWRCKNAEQDIDVQLQRRFDLIPNLVETTKGYATHESSTLENVIKARNSALNATSLEDKLEANNQITGALKSIFALSEAYPDLKANTNFIELQKQLTDTENRISHARMSLNDCVMTYNVAIQSFPGNIFAKMYNFTEEKGCFTAEEAKQNPKVQF